MIGRIVFLALLALIAALATVAQFDRASRYHRELALLVPDALAATSSELATRLAVASGEPELAQQKAALLVRHRPLPAENLSLLSVAKAMEGDSTGSLAALELASQRGWRDAPAQSATARAALQIGRYDIAAQRLAALILTGKMPDFVAEQMPVLLSRREGRAAFAGVLADGGKRFGVWLRRDASALDAAQMREVIALALTDGAAIDCATLRLLFNTGHAQLAPGQCDEPT